MRNPRTIAAVTRRALCLALVLFCFGAWLAPVANAQVGGIVDGVLDTVSGGDNESTASDADASSGQEDSGSSDGSLVDNVIGSLDGGDNKTESSNEGPLEELVNAINETADETGVSEVVGGTVNAVDYAASQLTGSDGTVKQVTKALTGNGGRDKKNPSAGPGTTSNYPTLEVLGQTFVNANRSNDGGSRQARVTSPRTATPVTSPVVEESVIAQIGRVAGEAIEKAAFPIALMLLVGGFLMVQNRIDRKDPKLALAPVDSERDLLIFT